MSGRGDDREGLGETTAGPTTAWLVILDAGERVIADKGFARATVEDVAAAAKVSVDVFYAHFQGKGALLRALNDRFVERVINAIDLATRTGSWSNAKAADLLDVAVRSILDVVFEHEGLLRAFLAHGATDRSQAEGLKKIGSHLASRLDVSFAETSDGRSVDARALAFSLLLAIGVAHHSVLVGDAWSGVAFTREELAHETARAIAAYLSLDTVEAEILPSSKSGGHHGAR
jgi:AcrR family transcriptional regulator